MNCLESQELAKKFNLSEKKYSCYCTKKNCITFEEYMAKHFPDETILDNKGG